jgi:hypothetical protein
VAFVFFVDQLLPFFSGVMLIVAQQLTH